LEALDNDLIDAATGVPAGDDLLEGGKPTGRLAIFILLGSIEWAGEMGVTGYTKCLEDACVKIDPGSCADGPSECVEFVDAPARNSGVGIAKGGTVWGKGNGL
jgi:hypothetical protein